MSKLQELISKLCPDGVHSNPSLNIDVQDFVKVSEIKRQNRIVKGGILFTGSSETPNESGFTSVVATNIYEPIYLNSFCFCKVSKPSVNCVSGHG